MISNCLIKLHSIFSLFVFLSITFLFHVFVPLKLSFFFLKGDCNLIFYLSFDCYYMMHDVTEIYTIVDPFHVNV